MKHYFHLRSIANGTEYRCELMPDSQERTIDFVGCRVRLKYSSTADRLDVSANLLAGEIPGTVACVELVIPDWELRNYLLLPAAVYNGNRTEVRSRTYPPQNLPGVVELDPPLHTSDITHFERDGGGVIEQTGGDMSFPGIGYYAPGAGKSNWILTPCRNQFGNYGFRLEEKIAERELSVMVTSPVYRQFHQKICRKVKAEDRAIDWKSGDEIRFELHFSERCASSVCDLFRHLADVRNLVEPHGSLPPMFPLSQADRRIKNKYLNYNWDEKSGYFMIVDKRGENAGIHWQIGWCGGGMATLCMLFDPDERLRKNARRNLDTIFTKSQAASGLYYGAANDGVYCHDTFGEPMPDNRHLLRKNADALSFLVRQLMLLERNGETIPETWKNSLRRNADAIASIWEKNRQFGQFVEMETGRILIGGSASAVMAIGALALAAEYFKEKRFLTDAEEAAEYYAVNYLEHGILNGAPGEIMQACDSEAGYAMLDSMMVLWEKTRNRRYLDWAEKAADYCMSWCVSYDYEFPPDSPFGKLGMTSCGTVWANVQNKHSAPGFCTGSGAALLKLFRANGKYRYLELARDVAHALPQYVSRSERPIGPLQDGWINERVNLSDWEGPAKVGNVFNGSCWPEVSLMLTYLELPGVYALRNSREAWNFDHVDAFWLENALLISNPTDYPAAVKVFIENTPGSGGTEMTFREIELDPKKQIRLE